MRRRLRIAWGGYTETSPYSLGAVGWLYGDLEHSWPRPSPAFDYLVKIRLHRKLLIIVRNSFLYLIQESFPVKFMTTNAGVLIVFNVSQIRSMFSVAAFSDFPVCVCVCVCV